MPEVRVSHVVIFGILAAIVAVPILIFAGVMGGFWFLTKDNMDKTLAGAKGYTKATTPDEAMNKFREAIHARDYQSASYYCTKGYGEALKKSHAKASELGGLIDKIHGWA